jgi:ubiquinone/menaquinone biosynthesis C-methylase UbiE
VSLYSRYIFPRLLDLVMSQNSLVPYRKKLLSQVRGKVLEIGLGTGINLLYYPPHVKKIATIDPNPGMTPMILQRIDQSGIELDHRPMSCAKLPFASNSFDCVVSTWTLCSIDPLDLALQEIHRVLKPTGKFYFLDHGLDRRSCLKYLQHGLTPINKVVTEGCHLNRNITAAISKNNFRVEKVDNFFLPKVPRIYGYMYQGIATPLQ